jgi:Fe-S cluster assembly ATP-binding protein
VLDETDSGLDIDALKIVSDGVNAPALARARDDRHHPLSAAARLHRAGRGARALAGRIVKTGGKELALELEARGYAE